MRPIDADALEEIVQTDLRSNPHEDRRARAIHQAEYIHFLDIIRRAPTITPPPNDPLTLEELREMDGEPVFIKRIGSDHPDDRAWALVDVGHELCKTVDGVNAFFEFFGKSWIAYRRKPEEGETWQQ